jgi:hypothetical protein
MPSTKPHRIEGGESGERDSDEVREPAAASERLRDSAAALERIEKHLRAMRDALDTAAREDAHRQYSAGRVIGAVLQVVVGGLVALALVDWCLSAPAEALLTKLAFAAVLQLAALSAWLVSRPER